MNKQQRWLENPENRQKARESTRLWKKRNAARCASYQSARRKKLNTGGYTQTEWDALLSEWNGACAYCGSTEKLEADHIMPLSRGGIHHISNILPACQTCNRQKYDRHPMEWLSNTRWNT